MKRTYRAGLSAAFALLAFSAPSIAAEQGVVLPPETASFRFRADVNAGFVAETCLECHSADYVTSQSPQTRASWKGTIDKMVNAFGMVRLSPEDEARVLDYLVKHYGQ